MYEQQRDQIAGQAFNIDQVTRTYYFRSSITILHMYIYIELWFCLAFAGIIRYGNSKRRTHHDRCDAGGLQAVESGAQEDRSEQD